MSNRAYHIWGMALKFFCSVNVNDSMSTFVYSEEIVGLNSNLRHPAGNKNWR